MDIILVKIVAIICGGITAQWIAWRFHLPAIVILSVMGILLGPVSGFIHPVQDFGEFYSPIISFAVSIILFEGGLALDFQQIKRSTAISAISRLVLIAPPISWALTTICAHKIIGLSLPVSALFGGILIVTGPTVIMPLLRQAKLQARVSALLKWEGIVNDPIGALLAVLVFEVCEKLQSQVQLSSVVIHFIFGIIFSIVIGYIAAKSIAHAFYKGWVPEFLKSPIILCSVLLSFIASNYVLHESGLFAVTVIGLVLANEHIENFEEIHRFKEYVTVLLVSSVFILITATLKTEYLFVTQNEIIFIACILFIIRPIAIFLATINSKLSIQERSLLGWIAPRGIVAITVCEMFANKLVALGYPDGARLIPLSFGIVFSTVIFHGFSLKWVAQKLSLASTKSNGIIIVGATEWSTDLAIAIQKMGIDVLLTDTSYPKLQKARLAGIKTYYGEILSEMAEYTIEFSIYGQLIACTENIHYNALICNHFAHEMGRNSVFQLDNLEEAKVKAHDKQVKQTVQGRRLFPDEIDYQILWNYHLCNWKFSASNINETFSMQHYHEEYDDELLPILALSKKNKKIIWNTNSDELKLSGEWSLLSYTRPESKETIA